MLFTHFFSEQINNNSDDLDTDEYKNETISQLLDSSRILASSPRRPLTGIISKLEPGEAQKVVFDAHYDECQLANHQNYFYVSRWGPINKKDDDGNECLFDGKDIFEDGTIIIIATLQLSEITQDDPNDVVGGNYICKARGSPGQITDVTTSTAERTGVHVSAKKCGLGTILTYLLFVDDDVLGSGIGYDIEQYPDYSFEYVTRLQMAAVAEKKCSKVIYMFNEADPSIASIGYINAALDAGFDGLLTWFHTNENEFVFKLSDLLVLFNGQTKEEKQKKVDEFIESRGNTWFFCKFKE